MSLFRTVPATGDFSPLFRLLDDYDLHRSSQSQPSSALRSFSPRFDVRETADSYHLDGELPGIAQKDIDIEFSDAQTLVIKGRVEREYHVEPSTDENQEEGAAAAQGESSEVTKTSSDKRVSKSGHKHKYWVSERSVGEFHRSFTFPTRVDHDHVKASLKNGVLSVVVPKTSATGTKKITIE